MFFIFFLTDELDDSDIDPDVNPQVLGEAAHDGFGGSDSESEPGMYFLSAFK